MSPSESAQVSSSVASSAVASTWGIGVQGIARLGYTVLIGRVFGTEALGHATALMSFSIFAALLWPTAAGNASSRALALSRHGRLDEVSVNAVLGRTMMLSSVVLALVTVPLALALDNPPVVAVCAAWLVVAYGAYAYARGAQLGLDRAGRVAVLDTVTALVALGALVAVCATGRGALVLAPLALGYTVFAAWCLPRARPSAASRDRLSLRSPEGRDVLAFTCWNVLAGLTTNGLLQLAMIAAQVVSPGPGAGVYAAAFTLATPASMLGQAVSQAVIPAFAHRTASDGLRDRTALLLTGAFAAVAAVLFAAVVVAAPWFLPLFYPAEADEALPQLRLLMVGVYVFTVGLVPAALLPAAGRSREVALASVAGFVVGVAVMPALAARTGTDAGSVGFLVGSAVNFVGILVLGLSRSPSRSGREPEGPSERA